MQRHPNAQTVVIANLNADQKTIEYPYALEKGKRFYFETDHYAGKTYEVWSDQILLSREAIIVEENAKEYAESYGLEIQPGTADPKTMVYIPMIVGDKVTGITSLQDIDHEHAFSPSRHSLANNHHQ